MPDDLLLICSDGLSGVLNDKEMLKILQQHPPPEAIIHLVDQANLYGGPDNISVVLVQALPQEPNLPLAIEVAPGAQPISAAVLVEPLDAPKRSIRNAGRLIVLGATAIVLLAVLIAAGLTVSEGGEDQESMPVTSLTPSPLPTLTVEITPSPTSEEGDGATPSAPAAKTAEPNTSIAATSTSVVVEPTTELP